MPINDSHATVPASTTDNRLIGRSSCTGPTPQDAIATISESLFRRANASMIPRNRPMGASQVRYCIDVRPSTAKTALLGNSLAAASSSVSASWLLMKMTMSTVVTTNQVVNVSRRTYRVIKPTGQPSDATNPLLRPPKRLATKAGKAQADCFQFQHSHYTLASGILIEHVGGDTRW